MTPQRLTEIKARCDAATPGATPGPWLPYVADGSEGENSPTFIVADNNARTDLIDLVAWAEKQMEWRDKMVAVLSGHGYASKMMDRCGCDICKEISALLGEAKEGATT